LRLHHAEVLGLAKRYTASDLISVFDAALLWYGKDPHQKLHNYGLHGWIVLLTRDRDVRDIAYTILSEIERGAMKAVESSWISDIPESWKIRLGALPAGRDPRHTKIAVSALTQFAVGRHEKPQFLSHLIVDSMTHTGAAGRPSAMHLVEREMEKRAAEGRSASKLSEEARQLSEWMKVEHRSLRAPTPKAISNSLRRKYQNLQASKASPK
jgi:hypothetical protein